MVQTIEGHAVLSNEGFTQTATAEVSKLFVKDQKKTRTKLASNNPNS